MVMNNHIHLLLQPADNSSLSVRMKWLLGAYTMNCNRVSKTWGSFWGGRYLSRPIRGFGDIVRTVEYIDAKHGNGAGCIVTAPDAMISSGFFPNGCPSSCRRAVGFLSGSDPM